MTRPTLAVAASLLLFVGSVAADPNENTNERAKTIFAHWTKERIDRAQPCDFFVEKKARRQGPRAVVVQLLKNRNGNTNRALPEESAAKAQNSESHH
jgi:hypothetical protein